MGDMFRYFRVFSSLSREMSLSLRKYVANFAKVKNL